MKFPAFVVARSIAGRLSSFCMQLCVNEIAQHKLELTLRDFVSVLFFLPPHGMCRRHQEKLPTHIVRSQRTEDPYRDYDQRYMRWELWMFAGSLVALHQITPVRDSMSKVKYRRI